MPRPNPPHTRAGSPDREPSDTTSLSTAIEPDSTRQSIEPLFDACAIGPRKAVNRLVAQPMEGGDGERTGDVSEQAAERYVELARGQWGIVFIEATSVTHTSVGRLDGLVLTEDTASSYERLIERVKAASPDVLLLVQLTHSGRQTHPDSDPVAVCPGAPEHLRYLPTEEIQLICEQHAQAADLAERIGFDGVDVKLCHGYFGTEILRPANTRPDRWGGSFENRTRFVRETYQRIMARRRSPGFLVGSRMVCLENMPGGIGTAAPDSTRTDLSEPRQLVRLLAELGADYVDVSGSADQDVTPPVDIAEERVATLVPERLVKEQVAAEGLDMPVIGSGYSGLGEDAAALAAARIGAGRTDMAGFGRQYFCDPHYPLKLRQGEPVVTCRQCGWCGRLVAANQQAGCVVHNPHYRAMLRDLRRAHIV